LGHLALFLSIGGVIRENNSAQCSATFLLHPQNEPSLTGYLTFARAPFGTLLTPVIRRASMGGVTKISTAAKCACSSKSDVTYVTLIICWFWLTWSYLRCGYEGKLSKAQHRKLSSEERELGKHCYYIESSFAPLNFMCRCTAGFALRKAWEEKTNSFAKIRRECESRTQYEETGVLFFWGLFDDTLVYVWLTQMPKHFYIYIYIYIFFFFLGKSICSAITDLLNTHCFPFLFPSSLWSVLLCFYIPLWNTCYLSLNWREEHVQSSPSVSQPFKLCNCGTACMKDICGTSLKTFYFF